MTGKGTERLEKTDAEWRTQLAPDEYAVCRCGGTERAYSGEYWDCDRDGVYRCKCCGSELFDAGTKFDSGTGWPSFWKPIADERVRALEDTSHGMRRVEVRCARCDAHLGHVFSDGPAPTGQRYCLNSIALELAPRDDAPR